MAQVGKNQPLEKNFWPNHSNPKAFDKPHVYKDGEYIETPGLAAPDYPKVKYHLDYVHNQKPNKEYTFTECAQQVNSAEEESELGPEWKDSPNLITCPNVKQVAQKQKDIGSNWRAALDLPADINETHVAFLQSQGLGHINNVVDACTFLGKLGSAAMNGFLREAEEWSKSQPQKRGPGRPPKEVA